VVSGVKSPSDLKGQKNAQTFLLSGFIGGPGRLCG
jgi:hypothetical protein